MITKACNTANYGGKRNSTKYIVIHYTSGNGDKVSQNLTYFAREVVKASAHYFVDENDIGSSVPENMIAYHVGAKSYKHPYCRNSNSIGIEMCSRKYSNGTYYFKDNTIRQAAKLTADLMKKYGVPIENVIRHYDVTGKICPEPYVKSMAAWTDFKKMVYNFRYPTYVMPESKPETKTEVKPEVKETEVKEVRYNKLENVPEGEFRETVKKLVEKGVVKGTGDGVLDLSEDMVRMLVYVNRAKVFD